MTTEDRTARRRRRTAVTLCATMACTAVLAVIGCSPTPPTSSWTPTTKYVGAPIPLPAPLGTKTATPADPALLQQATDVYTTFYQLDTQVVAQGGADQLPPDLAALLTEPALDSATQAFQDIKANGYHWIGTPQFQTDKVIQLMYGLPDDTDIALRACETTSGAQLLDGSGNQIADGTPYMVVNDYYLRFNDQHNLIIFDVNGAHERFDTCPI